MDLKLGTGKYDITGPCVKLGFMGMSNVFQEGQGLHTRLYSRAFIIEEIPTGKRIAIVCADTACCTIAIKQAVLTKLAGEKRCVRNGTPIYSDENLMLCASHTHCGPGGYSHFLTYNASIRGFNKENFDVIVSGICESIRSAGENMFPGRISIASADLNECGKIRSYGAFKLNPEVDEDLIPDKENVSPLHNEMVLLRFEDERGNGRGALNWFGIHTTNMGEKTTLISGDNKGFAQELFEKEFGVVSAFANSCCGDISPNAGKDENGVKYGRPDGIHDAERAAAFGRTQYAKVRELYDGASEDLGHALDHRHSWVDMSRLIFDESEGSGDPFDPGKPDKRTWPAALGFGMVNGSQEDSSGLNLKFWGEGTTCDNIQANPKLFKWIVKSAAYLFGVKWPTKIDQSIIEGQKKKEILFPLGLIKRKNNPIVPSILPLQILRIGSLIIVAHPGEMTDVAGIRMRDGINGVFANEPGVGHVVVSTYANAFASYTTTPEEYQAQHYEGASTLYGPGSFAAYQQENRKLAEAIRDGLPVDAGPGPEKINVKKIVKKKMALPRTDKDLPGLSLGEIETDAEPTYAPGQTVKLTFLGGHPNRDLRTGNTYFEVLKKMKGSWQRQHSDNDFCTRMIWNQKGRASIIGIEWDIPGEGAVEPGTYKIVCYSRIRPYPRPKTQLFAIESREFQVG